MSPGAFWRSCLLAAAGCVLGAGPAPDTRTFAVPRTAQPIKVDGILDEASWAGAAVIPVDLEWFPADNAPAPVATECLVTYDAESLYVAFRAADAEPRRIRAHLADRDTAYQDDTVGFFLDPFNDERRAFQFRINPLGVQMEATNSDVDNSEDWSWDAIWDSAGRIRDDGYDVEVRIPFSSLRFPRGNGVAQTWGFIAMRDYPRSARHRMRSAPTDRNRSCLVCQFHKLTGFEGITPGRNVELIPTLTGSRSDTRDPDLPLSQLPGSDMEQGDVHSELGLTARWGITPNLIANAALNPDFSQVEADAAQLDVNTRFALFFPEKRPFFLEGADFFGTPIQAVFTRTIADPSGALKLTGKVGPHALGVIVSSDTENSLVFPANQESGLARIPDTRVGSAILRYRRDVGRNSTLGALYASRDAQDYSNRVGGLDGTVRLSDADTVRFQYLASGTDYPADVARDNGQARSSILGSAWEVRYNHDERNWFWFANASQYSPDFRADSGFVTRVDVRSASGGLGRVFWGKPDSWFDRIEIFAAADGTQDHESTRTDAGQDLVVSYQGPLQTFAQVGIAPNKERFNGVDYDNFRKSWSFEIRPHADVAFFAQVRSGETIDFTNARQEPGVDHQARFLTIAPGLEFSLGRHVRGNADYLMEHLRVRGGDLYTARLAQGRLFYHINQRTFVRLILQHLDLELEVDQFLDPATSPRDEELLSQLLFSYKINPHTVVLVGYSDNYAGGVEVRGDDPVGLTQTDRTFFVKLGYAWVK